MDTGPEFVAYLAEFYNAEQIRAFWKEAGDALASRSRTTIVLNQRSRDGASSGGVALATPAEFAAFMAACRAALKQLGADNTVDPSSLATRVDFSRSPVAV